MLAFAAKRQEKSNSNKSLFKWWAHQDLNLAAKNFFSVKALQLMIKTPYNVKFP